jgi:hypothetical protein
MLLIPSPRKIRTLPGTCRIPAPLTVWTGSAEGLPQSALRELAARRTGRDAAAIRFLEAEQAPGAVREWALAAEGYALRIDTDGVTAWSSTAAGSFYAVMTLSQLLREFGQEIPCVMIGDAPRLRRRGVQLSFVQGHTSYRASYLRHLVPQLARWKINELYLYLESYFDFPSLPHFAGPGAMSRADAKALDALCAEHHIALIPMLNTLGHCGEILSTERYNHLTEYPSGSDGRTVRPFNLCASSKKTHRLIDAMLGDLIDCFSAKTIHVGGDEVSVLGECPRCRRRKIDPFDLYLEYYGRILTKLDRAGRRGGIWGDMLLNHCGTLGAADRDRIMAPLREQAIIYDWHYSGGGRESLELFAEAGMETVACSSTHLCYSASLWPGQYKRQLELFHDAAESGAAGGMTTAWTNQTGLHEEQLNYLHATGAALLWSGSDGKRSPRGISMPRFEAAYALHRYGLTSTQCTDYLHLLGDIDGPVLGVLTPNHGVDVRKCLYHTANVLDFWISYCDRLHGAGLAKYRAGIAQARELWGRILEESKGNRDRYFALLEGPLLTHEHLLARYDACDAMYRAWNAAAFAQYDDPKAYADHLARASSAIAAHLEDFGPVERYLKESTRLVGLEKSSLFRLAATKRGIGELCALFSRLARSDRPLPAFQQLHNVYLDPFRTRWYGDREHEWAAEPGRFKRMSWNEPGLWGAVPAKREE